MRLARQRMRLWGLRLTGLRLAGLGLAGLSLLFLAQGGSVVVKAHLAQGLLARAWAEAQVPVATVETQVARSAEVRPWPWADTWPVARLRVPAHGVDQIVLAGAEGRSLAFAPGHLAGSAAPGAVGNTVIAGHRDTHFRFLRHLAPGDALYLETADRRERVYRVVDAMVLDHRDGAVLEPTSEPVLTLITCYPFDAVAPGGPLRYVVRAVAGRRSEDHSTR